MRSPRAGVLRAGLVTGPLRINRRPQVLLTLAGALVLCLYWQSWEDPAHLIYDVPSAISMCAYLSQILCEAASRQMSPSVWARLLLVVPMSVIPSGREFLGWRISGHLTDMWAVALIQSVDGRLRCGERLAYWLPVPIVLWIRWFHFDIGGHGETFAALAAGTIMFLGYLSFLLVRVGRPPSSRAH